MEEKLPEVYKYKLSIITVNLNNRDGLQKTIDSVISQTFRDFEWIIIDGGSTDGSKEFIEKYSDNINFWVSEPDKGIYNAMNKGIKKAHGEYFYFLNSGDTLCTINTLKTIIGYLNGEGIYIGDYKINNYIKQFHTNSRHEILSTLLSTGLLHQSLIYHKNIFEKYGLYREDLKIISDRILNIKALILGNESYGFIPHIIVNFQQGGISYNNELKNKDKAILKAEYSNLFEIFNFYSNYFLLFNSLKDNKLFKLFFRFIRPFLKI